MLRRPDLLIALLGGALGAAEGALSAPAWDAGLVTGAVLGASLGLARSAPTAAWLCAAAVFLAAGVLGALPGTDAGTVAYVFAAAHALAAGLQREARAGVAGLVVLTGATVACAILVGHPVPIFPFITVASWGAGRALRERHLVAGQLAQRARELEAEREAFAALSVRYERARVAAELHDIVAHALSVMVVQAAAGQRLAARDPAATRETFAALAGAARQAAHETGLLVALLGQETAPPAGLGAIEDLVARANGSGLDVRLSVSGRGDAPGDPVAGLAYRVVQEALTNALRYAAGAPVAVEVHHAPEELRVEVRNGPAAGSATLAGTGGGTGLRGLRERAEAVGGTIAAGPAAGGGWRVVARLPVAPPVPVPGPAA